MRHILSTTSIRAIESSVEERGVSLSKLMERAGHAVAEEAMREADVGSIVVFCGPGNNGGDGWVAARLLFERGRDVTVVTRNAPQELVGIAREAAFRAVDAGVFVAVNPELHHLDSLLCASALVVDALLGIGVSGNLREPIASWLSVIERWNVPVLSVDLPTGLDPDTGFVASGAIPAKTTVTMIAAKPGLVGGIGGRIAGRVLVADLGIESVVPGVIADLSSAVVRDVSEYADLLPLPAADAHKYSRGSVLIIAGSEQYPGAAVLAASAAARCGSGYVTLAVPDVVTSIVQCHLVSTPAIGFPSCEGAFSRDAVKGLLNRAKHVDAVVIGPGLTCTDGVCAVVASILDKYTGPVLVDADAITIVANDDTVLRKRADRGLLTVLTPHAGEMARFVKRKVSSEPLERINLADSVANRYGAVVVLKGPATVISGGDSTVLSASGTPALATAGTGDVLSGMIGALLSQGLDASYAASLGVYLHGLAGQVAAEEQTEFCVIAEDVVHSLGRAVERLIGFRGVCDMSWKVHTETGEVGAKVLDRKTDKTTL